MNKKGMTLLELLVYMVLAAFLLAPVIMLMRNSSVTMARDAVNVDLRITGRDLLNIIYDDLKNTGFKLNNFNSVWKTTFVGDTVAARAAAATAAAGASPPLTAPGRFYCLSAYDWSSIKSGNDATGFYDTLTIHKGKLNDAGTWVTTTTPTIKDGIDTITYWVHRSVVGDTALLKRKIKDGTNADGTTQTLAKNVAALKFRYSEDLAVWEDDIDPAVADDDDRLFKKNIKYIKVIIVLRDNKKLAPTTKQDIVLFDDKVTPVKKLVLTVNDKALYERHEVVVPVPNNGLFMEEELAIYNLNPAATPPNNVLCPPP